MTHQNTLYVANTKPTRPWFKTETIYASETIEHVGLTMGHNGQPVLQRNGYDLHIYLLAVPTDVVLEPVSVNGKRVYRLPNIDRIKYIHQGEYRFHHMHKTTGDIIVTKERI